MPVGHVGNTSAVLLNQYCPGTGGAKTELRNASHARSSVIVSATQRRTRSGNDYCQYDVVTTEGGTGLIITVEQLNLREGVFNNTCIDFVSVSPAMQFHVGCNFKANST